jgi:hydrogenase/urease accessory protein HupE
MRLKLSNTSMAAFATWCGISLAAAHPGHAPTDVAAQVSAPLAGPDHLLVAASLTVLVVGIAIAAVKLRRSSRKTR